MGAENTRLAQEVEGQKAAVGRVDKLEREKQRLIVELERHLNTAGQSDGNALRAAPASGEVLSSARHVSEYDGYEPVAGDVYRTLVVKYNILVQNYGDLKDARKTLDKAVREERIKIKEWSIHCGGLDKKLAKQRGKIQRLEEELRLLRGPGMQSSTSASPVKSAQNVAAIHLSGQPHSNLDDIAAVLKSSSLGPVQIDGHVIGVEDFLTALAAPALKETIIAPLEIQVPRSSSPIKNRHKDNSQLVHLNNRALAGTSAGLSIGATSARDVDNNLSRPGSPELPMLLVEGHGDADIDDTEFEMILPHNSSSTEGEADHNSPNLPRNQTIPAEPILHMSSSPSMPVVISARSVRKRKGRKEPAGPRPVARIKIETITSSPLGLAALHYLDPSQGLDLDEIGEKQSTPRKQRPMQRNMGKALIRDVMSRDPDFSRRYRSESTDHSHPNFEPSTGERSQSTPVVGPSPRQKGSALQPRSPNQQILPKMPDARAAKRRRIASADAIQSLLEDGENIGASIQSIEVDDAPPPDALLPDLLDKPAPPKNNISPLYRQVSRLDDAPSARSTEFRTYEPDPADDFAGAGNSEAPRLDIPPGLRDLDHLVEKSNNGHHRGGLPSMEPLYAARYPQTGADTSRPSPKDTPKSYVNSSKPPSKGTFKDSAYGSRPPSRELPDTTGYELDLPLFKGQARMAELFNKPPSRNPPLDVITPSRPSNKSIQNRANEAKTSVSKRLSRAAGEIYNADVDHPANEPLRSRPLDKLDVDDFKINPNSNGGGHNFAYAEVVRGRERRCLPGCTKPDCCGAHFRFLAQVSRDPAHPPTTSQAERDVELCEEYLGANAHQLRSMTEAARAELLLQAQTRDLSNRYGRHRQAYERRRSPPGYWRFGFPSTQESLEDAAQQHAMQRDLVRTRYEEAMRPNGRYMFRDE